jgi:hypothetical protein
VTCYYSLEIGVDSQAQKIVLSIIFKRFLKGLILVFEDKALARFQLLKCFKTKKTIKTVGWNSLKMNCTLHVDFEPILQSFFGINFTESVFKLGRFITLHCLLQYSEMI